MKKTVLSIRSTRLCISRIIRLGKFAILGSFFEAVYGKAALYRGKFFGKAKKRGKTGSHGEHRGHGVHTGNANL